MFNIFKKKPVVENKSPVSLLDALGVSPYRTQETKLLKHTKNRIRKPYKLPAVTYAWIGFVSCLMAGVVPDAVNRFVPDATATPTAAAMAFMFLAFFCGFQASQKWKH